MASIPSRTLMSTSEYVQTIRPYLPLRAFRHRPGKLTVAVLHIVIIGGCFITMHFAASPFLWAALALVIGHSLACLAFFTHILSHGAVLEHGRLRYGLEVILWGF